MRLLLALALLCMPMAANADMHQAHDAPKGAVEKATLIVEHAYSFATAASQKNGVIFATITNAGDEDIRIIAAEADVSETVELHTHEMDGDVMQMRKVDGYDIPAGESLSLKPMAEHIMLMGLKAPLTKGDSYIAAIKTQDGQEIGFPVVINAPGEALNEHDHSDDAKNTDSDEKAETVDDETHDHHDH